MARYWVGGATGFLGRHVVRTLVDADHDVVAVSRHGGAVFGVPVMPIDVLDRAAVERSAWGSDGAFLATGKVSRDPGDAEELYRLNVVATREALLGLKSAGVRRVVVAGTSGTIAVGTDPNRVFDESAPTPLDIIAKWPYYRSKHYGELEALQANAPPDFEVVVVNPSLLLGPGDERGSSTEDVERFLDRAILAVPRGGISFVDVRDVATAMVAAIERGRPGERYLLTAQNCTLETFFNRLERLSGVAAPKLRMPRSRMVASAAGSLVTRALRAVGGEPPVDPVSLEMSLYYWYCDPSKAIRELGFSPRDPSETLRDTIDDLAERRLGPGAGERRPSALPV